MFTSNVHKLDKYLILHVVATCYTYISKEQIWNSPGKWATIFNASPNSIKVGNKGLKSAKNNNWKSKFLARCLFWLKAVRKANTGIDPTPLSIGGALPHRYDGARNRTKVLWTQWNQLGPSLYRPDTTFSSFELVPHNKPFIENVTG